jgi:hypothetical protein
MIYYRMTRTPAGRDVRSRSHGSSHRVTVTAARPGRPGLPVGRVGPSPRPRLLLKGAGPGPGRLAAFAGVAPEAQAVTVPESVTVDTAT